MSAALEPGRPPKTDKATILNDAVRILTQLRTEAQGLQESNDQLREAIKDLKVKPHFLTFPWVLCNFFFVTICVVESMVSVWVSSFGSIMEWAMSLGFVERFTIPAQRFIMNKVDNINSS